MRNSSCPAETQLAPNLTPFISDGNLNFQAHDVGWLIAGLLGFIACVTSFWLIDRHLVNFNCPSQQRHIVRLLVMVPVFSICSVLAYWDYKHYLYFDLVLECYEAVTIRAFFDLLVAYLSIPPPEEGEPKSLDKSTRKERERTLQGVVDEIHLKHWMFPLGFIRFRFDKGGEREGELFYWWMRVGVMQYFVLQVLCTVVAIIAEALGDYCENSWSPTHLHVWTAAIVSISITVAMYCILQLYASVNHRLAPFEPLLKLIAIKGVVFFEFWQSELFSFLQMINVIKDHQYWTASEISIGLNSLCTCFEMVCFALLHIKAFTYTPYLIQNVGTGNSAASSARTKRWPALKKVLILSDVARETGEEARYVGRAMLGKNNLAIRRDRDLEKAMSTRRDSGAVALLPEGAQVGEDDELEADLQRLAWAGVNEDGVDLGRIGPNGLIIRPPKRGQYEALLAMPPPHALTSERTVLALEDLYDGQIVSSLQRPRPASSARYSSMHMQPASPPGATTPSVTLTPPEPRPSYQIGQIVPRPDPSRNSLAQARGTPTSILSRLSTIESTSFRSASSGHDPTTTTYPSGFIPLRNPPAPATGPPFVPRPGVDPDPQSRFTQFVPPSRRAWRRSLGPANQIWEYAPY